MASKPAAKQETWSVIWSLMVLGMTLVFIYVIFFGVHGDQIKEHTQALAAQAQEKTPDKLLETGESSQARGKAEDLLVVDAEDPQAAEELSPRPQDLPGRDFHSFEELFSDIPQDSGQIDLQGTWKREGFMKSLAATELDQYASYILKDMQNTHYVFLGDVDLSNWRTTIQTKWGNIVAIEDKNAISQHQLRGDKVWFINLPEYQGIKVLLLVFFEDGQDVWFMQIDHDTYYADKEQFTKRFASWYTW